MSFVYPASGQPAPGPGVHALICGVSNYPNLPPPGTPPQAIPATCFGMCQLSSASRSATAIAQWLLDNVNALARPLASLRVLLSPQAGDPPLRDVQNQALPIERCSRANFVRAALDWRRDLQQDPNGIALFYFGGHGVQSTPLDSVLLMDDFNEVPGAAPLDKAVNTLNLYKGLSVHPVNRPNIARTQFWFVDACRVLPSRFVGYETFTAPAVWGIELDSTEQRSAPMFFAAQSGTSAQALPNDCTLFSKALLSCLQADAAQLDGSRGGAVWTISFSSLAKGLTKCLAALNKQYRCDQNLAIDGVSGDPLLRILPAPPQVRQSIGLEPPAAESATQVELLPAAGVPIPCPAFPPNPQELVIEAGFYTLRARVVPPAQFVSSQRVVLVEPTNSTLIATVPPAPGA